MKRLQVGDVSITSIIERDGPWRVAETMFPGARIVTIGAGFERAGGKEHYANAASARHVAAGAIPGTLVFAKGSRGIAVEGALPEEAR